MFPFIKIENKNYPSIIMGEDNFSGWFSKCKIVYRTEEERANAYLETLNTAYHFGARGFSMSPHPTLINVLKNFKKEHPEIVCIANPHFNKNYYVDSESLWTSDNLKRLTATIFQKLKNTEDQKIFWFTDVEKYIPFTDEEIGNFRLDEKEYSQNLEDFSEFCDFSLVGNIHRSALLLLGRKDLIIKESELVRKTKMIPILMCEAGVWALEKAKEIDCAGYWIYMNEEFGIPNINELVNYIKTINKPITAYKAFTRSDGFNVEKTVEFFEKIKEVKSLVVGVENSLQAKDTFSRLNKKFK